MSDEMPDVIWAANDGPTYGKWVTDGCTKYYSESHVEREYVPMDLVDELIAAVHRMSIAYASFRRGLIAFEDYEEAKKAEAEAIAKIRATPTGETE